MRILRWFSRSVATAALAVTGSVAANQVLNGGRLNYRWLGASLIVFVLAETMADVVGPRIGANRPSPSSPRRRGRPVIRRRRQYLRRLEHSVRDLETVGLATQSEFVLKLRQVYVDVSLVPQPPQDTAGEPYVGMVRAEPAERRTLSSFLARSDGQVFTAIGGPGSGKTTLVRRTALDLCRWSWRRRALPMIIYLRDHAPAILSAEPPGLPVVAASAGWTEGKVPAAWFERRLDAGGCLVMLDGLDEVADENDRTKVVGWTEAQIQRYPRNDYVITSRPHGYLSNPLPRANVLQVRRFTGEQISMFLHNWYYEIECHATGATGKAVRATASRKADDLLARLRRQPALYDLAANPLLLTMIANVHRYRDALPGSRAALYAEMCEVLLHRRQESKGLTDPTGLRGPQKEHIARALAWQMMISGVRDIPSPAARDAVQPVLAQVSRTVTPSEYLDEARKSGLLIERERGVYAFAHLTLQEYLAAAHITGPARVERLVRSVDDPWWRETILLWAAGADATPVINACLASGTVRALALAFDCADEALMVDPDVGRRLEALLTAPRTEADADGHGRVITAVKAARSLRDAIWLGEGTTVCARPVGRELYAMFARDEREAGRHTPDGGPGEGGDEAPAVGMWTSDAARFVSWVNSLFDAGTTYRLPTPDELADPAIGLVTDLDRYTVWVEEVPRPRLYRAGAADPYAPAAGWLRESIEADRGLVTPYLRLVTAARLGLDLDRVVALSEAFTTAFALAPVVDRDPGLGILDLVLNLTLAHTLDADRETSGERDLDLDVALDLALDFAEVSGGKGELDRARDVAALLGPADSFDRFRAKHRAIRRAFELATELDLNPEGRPHFAGETDRTAILKDVLARTCSRDFAMLADAHGRGDALAAAKAHAREFARDAERARRDGRRPPEALEPELARGLERDLAHDDRLIGHLDLSSGVATLGTTALAVDGLARLWKPARARRPRSAPLLEDFDAFLANLVSEPSEAEVPVPEDPAIALQNARDLMDSFPRHVLVDLEAWDHARRLTSEVTELVTPVLGRRAPYAGFTLACARLALVTTAALVLESRRDDVAGHLLEAVRGLAALRERDAGSLRPNEVLVLVRI
jgi:hypothetical protein